MRKYALVLAAAHLATAVLRASPALSMPFKKKAKNPGGFTGELNLFGDGAVDRAKHLAEKLEVDITDINTGASSILSALRKAKSDEAVRQAHEEAVRDGTYPGAEPRRIRTSLWIWRASTASSRVSRSSCH